MTTLTPAFVPQADTGKQTSLPLMAAVLFAAIVAHVQLLPLITTDVALDFSAWYRHIVQLGPVDAFAAPFGAYTPPYLYLLALATPLHGLIPDEYVIKLLAVGGSVALALAVAHLLEALDAPHRWRMALYTLCLPGVMLNAALIGQCDAMYVAPIVMGLAACVRRKHVAMLVWCGLAFAIKPQAVFIAPFVLALLLARRVPFVQWLAAPAVFLATLVPAWAAGWPAYDLLMINLRQVETSTAISRNAPNIWMVFEVSGIHNAALSGLATILTACATLAYVAWGRIALRQASHVTLLRFAILSVLLTAGLMPRMHERYFLVADVLVLVLVGIERSGNALALAGLVTLGSLLAIFAYAMGIDALAAIGAAPMIAATVLTIRHLARARAKTGQPVAA